MLLLRIAMIAACVAAFGLGYYLRPLPEPHRGVWIEFENLQHAIDSAMRLGGNDRGLTVCLQTTETITVPVWNPGVSVSGDIKRCAFSSVQHSKSSMHISRHAHDTTISSLSFYTGDVENENLGIISGNAWSSVGIEGNQ